MIESIYKRIEILYLLMYNIKMNLNIVYLPEYNNESCIAIGPFTPYNNHDYVAIGPFAMGLRRKSCCIIHFSNPNNKKKVVYLQNWLKQVFVSQKQQA